MENFKLYSLLLILLFSCSEETELEISGRWKTYEVTIENESLLPHQRLQLNEELKSMVLDLKDDGVIVYSNYYRTGAHGNWELKAENDSLILNYEYERAVITDAYAFDLKENKMSLNTSGFEGTKSVSLLLSKD